MTIAIIGNGAIGNLLCVTCAENELDFFRVVRKPIGDTLSIIEQTRHSSIVAPCRPIGDLNQAKLVILPLKAYQIVDAAAQIRPYLHEDAVIMLCHNGMGTHTQVAQLLPSHPLIIATTSYGAFKPNSEALTITGRGATQAGWWQPNQTNQTIQQIVSGLLPPCTWSEDIILNLWQKVIVNAVINPLTAIHKVKNGVLLEPEFANQTQQIVAEIIHLLTALGYNLFYPDMMKRVQDVMRSTAENYSSMHQDIVHQRRTEIDFINGYIVKQAKRLGIKTPLNERLYSDISQLEAEYATVS